MSDEPTAEELELGPTRRRRRWPRRVAIALGVLAVVVGSSWYVFFAWATSSGRLDQLLAPRADRFRLHAGALRSPWPFVVDAEDLTVEARTPRLRWQVTAKRARVRIQPLALLDRRLVISHAKAVDAVFQLARESAPDARPVAGSADAPRRLSGEHRPPLDSFTGPPPTPTERKKPWSWELPEIELENVRQVWLDDLKLDGAISGTIGFRLSRREWAEIYRSRVHVADTRVELDGARVADGLVGDFDLQTSPWRYRGNNLEPAISRLQGSIRLAGATEIGPLLRTLLGERKWLTLGSQIAAVETRIELDRGRILAGSRFDATLPEASLRAFGFDLAGKATLATEVGGERDRETVSSRLSIAEWALGRSGEAPIFHGQEMRIDATLEAPRLGSAPQEGLLDIDLGRGRAENLAFVDELLPDGLGIAVRGGALELVGKIQFAAGDRSGAGSIDLSGERIALDVRGQRLIADLSVDLRLSAPDVLAASFALGGSKLALTNVQAATTGGSSFAGWWGETELVEGRIDFRKPFRSSGRIRSRMADTRPVIAFYELKRNLPKWAEKILLIEDVKLEGRYDVAPGAISLREVAIPFENGGARGEIDLGRGRRHARLLLSWRRLDLGVELEGKERDLHLIRAREWYERTGAAPKRREGKP